jgi:hypothetical protein
LGREGSGRNMVSSRSSGSTGNRGFRSRRRRGARRRGATCRRRNCGADRKPAISLAKQTAIALRKTRRTSAKKAASSKSSIVVDELGDEGRSRIYSKVRVRLMTVPRSIGTGTASKYPGRSSGDHISRTGFANTSAAGSATRKSTSDTAALKGAEARRASSSSRVRPRLMRLAFSGLCSCAVTGCWCCDACK